jgi:rRNA maturation protein Nop10
MKYPWWLGYCQECSTYLCGYHDDFCPGCGVSVVWMCPPMFEDVASEPHSRTRCRRLARAAGLRWALRAHNLLSEMHDRAYAASFGDTDADDMPF